MTYIEARAKGQDTRVLDHLEITGGETAEGEKCWIVCKYFESEHNSPEDTVFLLDQLDEVGKFVTDVLGSDLNGEAGDAESEESESEAGY